MISRTKVYSENTEIQEKAFNLEIFFKKITFCKNL